MQHEKQKKIGAASWRKARPELNRSLAREILQDTALKQHDEPAHQPASTSVAAEPEAEQATYQAPVPEYMTRFSNM